MNTPRFPPFDSLPHQLSGKVTLLYDPAHPDAITAAPAPPVGLRVVTNSQLITANDAFILVNTVAGAVTLTLPPATFKFPIAIHWKTPGSHSLTITAAGTDLIEGAASHSFASGSRSHTFRSDGAAYWAVF